MIKIKIRKSLPQFQCPDATQNPELNNENRQTAIDKAMYGPPNPSEINEEFWKKYAEKWNTSVDEVKTMRCKNCRFFETSSKMKKCMEEGIENEKHEQWDAGGFGYCHKWDFMCREERTCFSWAGSPIEEKKQPSEKSLKKMEKSLRKTAKEKFPGDEERQNKYIYGAKRKTGWKPEREKK